MPAPRKLSLETPTARLKLPIRKKCYWQRLGRGLSLGYRRNQHEGVWSIRAANGRGREQLKKFGAADDREPADGKRIFSHAQAVDAARQLVHGDVPNSDALLTVREALAAYGADLEARGANPYNAEWPLLHLPPALLTKPVALVPATEWRKWRDSLPSKVSAAAANRLAKLVSAALTLAASHDERLASNRPWKVGLQGLPNATQARNMILTDDQIHALVEAANAKAGPFGLFAETLATTGARPSQVARLEVGDLRLGAEPKLMMPRSGKGGGRLRVNRKASKIPVPITLSLAARLREAAADRAPAAPLLLWKGDRGWGADPSGNYRAAMSAAVAEAGVPADTTAYAFRHSSICRQLLANTPVRIVAVQHDTSIIQIEAHYSKYISEHSDALSRKALLQFGASSEGNVVRLR
jgi:integrase